jgi:F420-0:gamma-glutamyl ligase-like protein
MKPSFAHYVLAHTAGISAGIGALGGVALLIQILRDSDALIPDTATILWSIVAAVPMAAMGWVFGMAFIWMIVGRLAARFQGWPFQVGDEVCILSGKHINRITRIYEIWDERGQVRIDLGEEAKNAVEDVFCAVAVCRTKTQNKSCEATGDNVSR